MGNGYGSVRVGNDMAERLALLSPVTSPKNRRTLEVMTSLQRQSALYMHRLVSLQPCRQRDTPA
jgi:hypothetical protein